MARRELGPAALEVAQAVARVMPQRATVGVSGGADSMALAMGAGWAAQRSGADVRCIVVDHGLQPASSDVATQTAQVLRERGLRAEVRPVEVQDGGHGLEAAARDARLKALAGDGRKVLLGHTLDDQAEQVLLGVLRGSGTRSLAGMATTRGPFLRPLLDVRRATTEQACREWGLEVWNDPHNDDPRFARVRARRHLSDLCAALERDVAPMLARTAHLARLDADLLDEMAGQHVPDAHHLDVSTVAGLPGALRLRVLKLWLRERGLPVEMVHVLAAEALVDGWRGQGSIDLPGGSLTRRDGQLQLRLRPGLPGVGD